MNYKHSNNNITPNPQDTQAFLWNTWKQKLNDRTRHDIPFFLMPVRIETRFMEVTESLYNDIFSEPVTDVLYDAESVTEQVISFGNYQGFTPQIAFNTGKAINNSLNSLLSNIQQLPSLMPVERNALSYKLNSLSKQLSKTSPFLRTMVISDEELIGEFDEEVIPEISSLLLNLKTAIDSKEDSEFESIVSTNTINILGPSIQYIIDANSTIMANMFNPVGGIIPASFDSFIDSNNDLIEILKSISIENTYDKQYLWRILTNLEPQLSSLYNSIQSLKTVNPAQYQNFIRPLYKTTARLRDVWKGKVFHGIAEKRIMPFPGADNYDFVPATMPALVTSLGANIETIIGEADTILGSLINQGEGWDTLLFDNYANKISSLRLALDGADLNEDVFRAYISLRLAPINLQFNNLRKFIGDLQLPIGNTLQLEAYDNLTIDLSNSWEVAVSTDLGTVNWFDPFQPGSELWIRVYPDEIFINSHEKPLTQAEVTAGHQYWNSWYAAYGDTNLQLAAWQTLVNLYGAERAAWIIRVTTPTNLSSSYTSSVFKLVNVLNLLDTYTTQLSSLYKIQGGSESILPYLDFFTPQLGFLNSEVAGIEGLPEVHARIFLNVASNAARNFQDLGMASGGIDGLPASPVDGEFKVKFRTISAGFAELVDSVIAIPKIDGFAVLSDVNPAFPSNIEMKALTWESASYSNVMPDRFLFAAVDNYTVNYVYPDQDDEYFGSHLFRHVRLGNKIPDPLYTGIDPQSSTFSFDTINNLQVDPNLKWMIDFPTAIGRGMATRIRVTADEMIKGFDKVLVLGVKAQESSTSVNAANLPNISKGLLEGLLDNHHYSHGGMEILQLGAAVKNTDETDASYLQTDTLSNVSFQTETQAPLFGSTNNILDKKDGQWLADAIGINYSVFQHIKNSDKTQISSAIAMNRALWEGTAGNYMKEMMNYLFTEDNVVKSKDYFTDYVLARGPLPSLRIAGQPYGMLPTTSFSRWAWKKRFHGEIPDDLLAIKINDDNTALEMTDIFQTYLMGEYKSPFVHANSAWLDNNEVELFLQDRFDFRLANTLQILNRTWLEMANWYVKTVDKNTGTNSAQQDFIEILGTNAVMSEAYSRPLVSNALFDNHFDLYKQGDLTAAYLTLYYTASFDFNEIMDPLTLMQGPLKFFELFNNFNFTPPATVGPNKLGGPWGIQDIPDFLKYKESNIAWVNYQYALSGIPNSQAFTDEHHPHELNSSADPDNLPIPDLDRLPQSLRIFLVNILKDKYKLNGPLVHETKVSESSLLSTVNNLNYIQWLRNKYTTLDNIMHDNAFNTMQSRSLLFLLLRQSTLLTYRETALDAWERAGVFEDPKLARKILGKPEGIAFQSYHADNTFLSRPLLTPWHFLFNSAQDLLDESNTNPNPSIHANAYRLFTAQLSYYKGNIPAELPFGTKVRGTGFPTPVNYPPWPTWYTDHPTLPLSMYLRRPENYWNAPINDVDFTKINAHNDALGRLATCTSAELDRLTREHIDLCTNRLDAWNYGMVNKRLWDHRNMLGDSAPNNRKTGVYLGAYGWVLNVRPKPAVTKVKHSDLPSHLTNAENAYWDSTNLGFMNTPSNSHALSAALLRCGYISEYRDSDNRFAVNLSSERVALAKSLIDGIKSGYTLEGLLGYEFERGLHEHNLPLLNSYIIDLRREYPLVQSSSNLIHARPVNVVDAVALLKVVKSQNVIKYFEAFPSKSLIELFTNANYTVNGHPLTYHYPFNTDPGHLPGLGTPELLAVMTQLDKVANAIDGLGDLLLAEGVFQLAKGNLDRTSATLESLTEGKNPPDIELIETPKRGLQVSHKLVGMFQPYPSTANPWSPMPLTPRSIAEPNVNNWMAKIIQSLFPSNTTAAILSGIGCKVTYNNIGQLQIVTVTIEKLALQPVDLLYLAQTRLYKDELISRIKHYVRGHGSYNMGIGVPQEIELTVDISDQGTAALGSLHDLHSVLLSSLTVISGSKWLQASDFAYSLNNSLDANIPLYNSAEFIGRATNLKNSIDSLRSSMLSNFNTTNNTVYNLTNARNHLILAAAFGFNYSIPDYVIENNGNALASISSLTKKVIADINKRSIIAQGKLTQLNLTADEQDKMKLCGEIFAAIIGEEFKAYPHFGFGRYINLKVNIDTVLSATGNDNILRNCGNTATEIDESMDTWLYGLARVHDKIDSIETIRLFSSEASVTSPLKNLRPVQFPYITSNLTANPPIPQTDYWVGTTYPSAFKPAGDKTSINIFDPGQLANPFNGHYCGFVIEEWSEIIPFDSQNTGIAFNYNQPSSKPPQNVLLAISPQAINSDEPIDTVKHWNVEDLLYTLLDTIDMAKIRMVEPDHFKNLLPTDKNGYTGQTATSADIERSKFYEILKWVLPGIVGDIVPKEYDQYQNFDRAVQNVSFDYNPNNDLPPKPPSGHTFPGPDVDHIGNTTDEVINDLTLLQGQIGVISQI